MRCSNSLVYLAILQIFSLKFFFHECLSELQTCKNMLLHWCLISINHVFKPCVQTMCSNNVFKQCVQTMCSNLVFSLVYYIAMNSASQLVWYWEHSVHPKRRENISKEQFMQHLTVKVNVKMKKKGQECNQEFCHNPKTCSICIK